MRIGAGAGYAGDRIEPAVELARLGSLDFLVFECLGERTIARENQSRLNGVSSGYNPFLEERMRAVLRICAQNGVRIVTNMGGADPWAAGQVVARIAAEVHGAGYRVAVVEGDDVMEQLGSLQDLPLLESGEPLDSIWDTVVSANAYLGAEVIADSLRAGADAVITGRVADPSLFLGPMLADLGWSYDDYALLAQGTMAGHLLECAGQVSGGYFADPGVKDVPGLDRLGFPFADVSAAGEVVISKVAGSGGRIDRLTCTEQLLYEVHDPTSYITPDCVLDVTHVQFDEVAPDAVRAAGARATARTETLKVTVGYRDGYMGEGQISYGGPNAVSRARLAAEIVLSRLEQRGLTPPRLRVDLIGMTSLHGAAARAADPYEVRLRVAGTSGSERAARSIGEEVETLLTNGPCGGAGDFKLVKDVLAVQSVLLPRGLVTTKIRLVES
jgi:hypothetical protein